MGFRDPLRSACVANRMPRYFYNSTVLLLISVLPIGARGLAGTDAPCPPSAAIGSLVRVNEFVQCGRGGSADNGSIAWVEDALCLTMCFDGFASGGDGQRPSIGFVDSHEDTPDIDMACVSKRRIADRMDCESFADRDGAGRPMESADIRDRVVLSTDPRGTRRIAMRNNAGGSRWVWDYFHADFADEAVRRFCRRSTAQLKLNILWLPLNITEAPLHHVSHVGSDDIVVARECMSPITPIAIQR